MRPRDPPDLVHDLEQVFKVDLGKLRRAAQDADLGLRRLIRGELDPRRVAPRREGVRPRGEDQVGVEAPKFPADVLRPDHRYLVRWPLEAHGQDQCLPVGTRLYSYQDLRETPFPFSSVLRTMVMVPTARRIPQMVYLTELSGTFSASSGENPTPESSKIGGP